VNTDLAVSTVTATGVPISIAASRKTDRFGWTVGAGIETMFASNWSAKLEYLYVDLGSISNSVVLPTTAGFPLAANVTSRVTDNIIRAGINYHFSAGPGPVVARY
jgi:outer membrane immunogenic protein